MGPYFGLRRVSYATTGTEGGLCFILGNEKALISQKGQAEEVFKFY